MATKDRDREQERDDNDNTGTNGQSESRGIEHISRLSVSGINYEAAVVAGGESLVRVTVETPVKNQQLDPEDIENLVQFFNVFHREQRRANRSQMGGASDGRGRVTNPQTDGRLKGNEDFRPNDPDRSRQAEGGRRGGQN